MSVYWILGSLLIVWLLMGAAVAFGLYADNDRCGVSPVDDEAIR